MNTVTSENHNRPQQSPEATVQSQKGGKSTPRKDFTWMKAEIETYAALIRDQENEITLRLSGKGLSYSYKSNPSEPIPKEQKRSDHDVERISRLRALNNSYASIIDDYTAILERAR
ncbi:hypothetical protein L0Z66_03730 [Phaeobacter sp. BS34]|uniref:hypothetical protein n=1 Tax=Phaeobacter inhibens TaxID=221822 RepID=UPI0011D19A71|nr:hypothetical protein [Phaeobacter inhibens]